jgi:hypothetical protein
MSVFQLGKLMPTISLHIPVILEFVKIFVKLYKEHRYEIYQGWKEGQREVDHPDDFPMGSTGQTPPGPTNSKAEG